VAKSPAPIGAARHDLHIDERRGGAPADHAMRSSPSAATGQSLAARAERFRNGAPFLVERATLYDPDPLDLPVAPADRRLRAPRSLLPAALTLLGVVIVVGLAAGILFVRNADVPRRADGTGRLEQFSERVAPRAPVNAPAGEPPTRRDQVTYDLTRRSNDTIVGAWRLHKELGRQTGDEAEPAESATPAPPPEPPPEVVSAPTEAPPQGLRRLMPRRLTGWLAKRKGEQIAEPAEPAVPSRPPLDDPYVPNAAAEVRPAAPPRAPLDDPYVSPKASAHARPVAPQPQQVGEAARQQAAPDVAEHPGANVVARVGRAIDPKEPAMEEADGDGPAPSELTDEEKREATRKKYAVSRARRAELRRQREARRFANDLDRFRLRDKGQSPNGFVFSGPQAQSP
jgi:hypothetical protein